MVRRCELCSWNGPKPNKPATIRLQGINTKIIEKHEMKESYMITWYGSKKHYQPNGHVVDDNESRLQKHKKELIERKSQSKIRK